MKLIDFSLLFKYWDTFMMGFGNTVKCSLIALVLSFLLGTVIAVFRISPFKPLNWLGTAYVEFIRNIPLLLVAFFFFLGLPALHVQVDPFWAGTLGLSIYTASFIAEAVRAGIQSIPRGQMEAARSTGLSYMQAMTRIVLPQAIRVVIPPLGNQFINLIKNSSILGVIAGKDLMYYADIVNTDTFRTFAVYVLAGLLYLSLTIPLSIILNVVERRLARHG